MKEQDIEYENGRAWVLRDRKKCQFTVFVSGATHSTSDSSYPLTDDGRSIAVARADYIAKRLGAVA
jgi:hypothetical protein